ALLPDTYVPIRFIRFTSVDEASPYATMTHPLSRQSWMQIQVHSTPEVFSNLRGDWNALLKQSPSDSIFLTREFQQTWWTHLGSGELRVLTAHDDGQLRGIAPLYLDSEQERRVLRLVGGLEVADYLDII